MTTESSSATTSPNQTQTANVTSPIVTGDNPQPVVASPVVEPIVKDVDPAAVAGTTTSAPVVDLTTTDINKTIPDALQKRINDLTARRYEAERVANVERLKTADAERKTAELIAQLAKSGVATATVDPTTGQPIVKAAITEADIEKLAQEKAVVIAQANEFNKACNNIVEIGKKEFGDWDDSIKNLSLVGAIGQGANPAFLETAIELKNPQKILHHLGKNMEEAERITKLPPTKMAMEMARIEAQLNAPAAPVVAPAVPPISQAPAPVITVGGGVKPGEKSIDDPNLSMEEYNAIRNRQAAERRARYTRA